MALHIAKRASCFGARWLILARDDGGRWRLDTDADAERLVGQRVRVQGIRAGFDLLDVRSIERA